MGAIGMCPRGDRCRYAHITESELESEDSDDTSDSSAADDLRHDPELKDVSQGGSVEASNQTSSKVRVRRTSSSDPAHSLFTEVQGNLQALLHQRSLFHAAL